MNTHTLSPFFNTSPPWMRAPRASFPQIATPSPPPGQITLSSSLPHNQTSSPLLKPLSRHKHPSLPQAPIHKHRDLFYSSHKIRSSPQAPRLVPVNFQVPTHSHKFTTMLSLFLLVCLCVGVFDFYWFCGQIVMYCNVVVVVVGNVRLRCWVDGLIGCRDFELKIERVRGRERPYMER